MSSTGEGVGRRALVGAAAGAVLATGLAVGTSRAAHASAPPAAPPPDADDGVVPFRGEHQAGITTAAQDRMHFVALDVTTDDVDELREMLTAWTRAAERMTVGAEAAPGGVVGGGPWKVPEDTGEAMDLPPSSLTITIGYGPSLFERLGMEDRRPEALRELPPFAGDDLDEARSGGDICIQACADDPQVAVHAVRNLSRIAFGRAHVRWSQMGFGRTSRTTADQATPRNLFGFKDGTANVLASDADALASSVWVGAQDEPAWLAGGSYLVARKIEMLMETWDRVQLGQQQTIVGRDKQEGAPLSGGTEMTVPDFAVEVDGAPAIDVASHVRLAHPDNNGGARLLRRGYNYVDGSNALGRLDAGLFFLAYVRDVEQFVTVQRALSTDLLNEYVRHIGSATFAIPPGAGVGGYVGETLFT